MNLKQRLKMEKELFFLRYVITKPLESMGGLIYEIVSKPKNWLFIEGVFFIALLYRDLVKSILANYPVQFDILCWYGIAIMFITFMIDIYVRQSFQDEYKEWKQKQIEEDTPLLMEESNIEEEDVKNS